MDRPRPLSHIILHRLQMRARYLCRAPPCSKRPVPPPCWGHRCTWQRSFSTEREVAFSSENVDGISRAAEGRIFSLFDRYGGSDYIGEPVSTQEHSIQAALLARQQGESADVQVACLLHDVGHLCGLEAGFEPAMDGCGTEDHETVGATFLGSLGFPDTVVRLAAHHVNAKRFRCAREPEYYEKLSEASQTTLRHQGGPMTDAECAAAEADPLWPTVLRMRGYDEMAKQTPPTNLPMSEFSAELRAVLEDGIHKHLERRSVMSDDHAVGHLDGLLRQRASLSPFASSYVLSSEQLRRFHQEGFLIVRNALNADDIARLSTMADDLAALSPGMDCPWMMHHEMTSRGDVQICRVENFCKSQTQWGKLAFGVVQDLASQAFGESAVLFKDKLNFKAPGGGGFLLHQDATAYAPDELANRHISVRLAVDESMENNGPLEIAPGRHREGILPHIDGVIGDAEQAFMAFEQVLVAPGEVVLFDSYLPHRSFANDSDSWRRSAYLTYNPESQGDLHAAYYEKKQAAMRAGQAGSISINKDFGGKIVS